MTENNKGKILGTLESEVMEFVWQQENPISVRDVYNIVHIKRQIAYTTVMTIMNRLVDKKLLKRSLSGRAYTYKATATKDRFLTNASKQIIKNFVNSFGETAIAHFVEEIDKIPLEKRNRLLKILRGAKVSDDKIK